MLNIRWKPSLENIHIARSQAILQAWYSRISKGAHDIFDDEHKKPGRGRVYKRRGKTHRASAPGDYPATDSGRLLGGTRDGSNSREGYLGTNVFYAKFLLGTRKIAPRKLFYEAMKDSAKKDNGRGLEGYLRWKAK